jgi:hypothetical protein
MRALGTIVFLKYKIYKDFCTVTEKKLQIASADKKKKEALVIVHVL